ncbi:RIO1 family-domain-containing protein [Lyophyllum atratum]|nr:RIO1 family-domain-containing protein [Lyophyllum atratum]
MKLDATDLRYVTSDEFRVLTAVEMGSKNHEVVPTVLIAQISGLRNGGVNKLIASLAKRNLVSRVQNAKYDGYRLTYGGYDYLAMRAMSRRDTMHSVGNQIGVGKESDIYIVADSDGKEMVLKLHRLGRISFRAIKEKRDYLGKRKSASWMYMSRLAAQKEWAFMKVLHEHGFPVPTPIDQARHCILMEFIDAYPLRQIAEVPSPGKLYSTLMDLIVRFARAGLIHGDFNEFNILIRRESGEPIVIDFPQMVSTSHENAEWYFNRDVECIRTFFKRRFQYESALYPKFRKTMTEDKSEDGDNFQLDVVVAASGFGRKDQKILEEYMETVKTEGHTSDDSEEEEEEESEEEEDEEKEEEEESSVANDAVESSTEEMTEAEKAHLTTLAAPERPEDAAPLGNPDRPLSRSPPQSRPTSPSLANLTSALDLNGIKNIVSGDLTKSRASQQRKYHSKRGARRVGRPQGSKAKQDTRVKLDRGGMWD